MKIRSRISGLGSFGAALSHILELQSLAEILSGEAEGIRSAARARLEDGQIAENRSGALAESLTVRSSDNGLSFTISTRLEYSWHLEFGSLDRAPAPWLAPALDDRRPAIITRIRNWLAASRKRSAARG